MGLWDYLVVYTVNNVSNVNNVTLTVNNVFGTVLDITSTEIDSTSLQLIFKRCLILKIRLLWIIKVFT